jgi:hypothetical protein
MRSGIGAPRQFKTPLSSIFVELLGPVDRRSRSGVRFTVLNQGGLIEAVPVRSSARREMQL